MSNSAFGVIRVVAKSKDTLDRLEKILTYKDNEFFVYRCSFFGAFSCVSEHNGLFVRDYEIEGANDCEHLFASEEDKDDLLFLGYEKDENGQENLEKKIYGTAHRTNLVELAKTLDFGCELFSEEPSCAFCEHILCNHLGEVDVELGDYIEEYPLDENGEPDESAEPTISHTIQNFNELGEAGEIYGD